MTRAQYSASPTLHSNQNVITARAGQEVFYRQTAETVAEAPQTRPDTRAGW